MVKKILAILFGFFCALILLEIILHIYNPFPTRLKGDNIILPTNRIYKFRNSHISGLDKEIVHTKNSLGFRGDEKPLAFGTHISIITVGGSTTECFYLSDTQTWPYLLGQKLKETYSNVWINNAGLDGHSTFGHQLLLNDFIVDIRPNFIFFLVGANDVARDDLTGEDAWMQRGKYSSLRRFLWEHSEVVMLITNIKRMIMAGDRRLRHGFVDLTDLEQVVISEDDMQAILTQHKKNYLNDYAARIKTLIATCSHARINPVFITQPVMWGEGIDEMTGVDLETVKVDDDQSGELNWRILELYNDVVRTVCADQGVPLIDLARKMPKGSRYFYDRYHFTIAGAEMVAGIISDEIKIRSLQQ